MAAHSVSIDIYIKTIDARTATMAARSLSIDIYIKTIDARSKTIDAHSVSIDAASKQSILTAYQWHFDTQNKKVTPTKRRDLFIPNQFLTTKINELLFQPKNY